MENKIKLINETFLEIVYIFVLPIVLIYLGVIPSEWKDVVLVAGLLLMYFIARHGKWSAEDVGIKKHFSRKEILAYFIFTALGVFAIVLFAKFLGFKPISDWWRSWHLTLFFIPISILQEAAYRGFLMHRLKQVFKNRYAVIFLNTLLFILLHIIYPLPIIMLTLAAAGGLLFSILYYKYPNLALISISHSILNFTAVLFGFFIT